MVGSVAGSLGLLGLSLVSSRVAAGYGNSFFAAAILFAALSWRLAVDPLVDSPLRRAWSLIGRIGKTSKARPIAAPTQPRPQALLKGAHKPSAADRSKPAR